MDQAHIDDGDLVLAAALVAVDIAGPRPSAGPQLIKASILHPQHLHPEIENPISLLVFAFGLFLKLRSRIFKSSKQK